MYIENYGVITPDGVVQAFDGAEDLLYAIEIKNTEAV